MRNNNIEDLDIQMENQQRYVYERKHEHGEDM